MTSKELHKKKMKISEEAFFKNKSEVLWSRDNFFTPEKDLYVESCGSFTDVTGGTASTCSWHNDEFDIKTTSEVNASLVAIDDALYEKKKSSFINDDVFHECCDWSDKFPYLRLIGQQIQRPLEDCFSMHSASAKLSNLYQDESLPVCLQVEGKKITTHISGRVPKEMCLNGGPGVSGKVLNYFEETADGGCEYEEIFAVDISEVSDEVMCNLLSTSEMTSICSTVKLLQEKIIDRLSLETWTNVLTVLQKHFERFKVTAKREEFQLPPIAVTMEKAFCFERPKTEGNGLSITEFPKLNCILSVSPKVLQKKTFSNELNTRATRPTSEMSLSSRNVPFSHISRSDTFKTVKSINLYTHGQYKSSSGNKEENTSLFLPTLKEDIPNSAVVLRGFHIEPEVRDLSNKSVISSHNDYEACSSSKKYNCFLPPIENSSLLPTNVKLVTKSQGNMQPKSMNIGCTKVENRGRDADPGRLFPLVKSLVPYKEKNYTCVKKGLLHAFVGRRR